MSFDEQKEKLSVKIDEKKVQYEEKKAQAKIKREEKKLELKESYTEKKISAHIEKAIKIMYEVEDDVDKDVIKLLDATDAEIEAGEEPIEFILFKTQNKLQEILLKALLKLQKTKNDLIKNLAKDMKDVNELVSIEEDISVVKDEMDEISTLLNEKIDIEKETLNLKSE